MHRRQNARLAMRVAQEVMHEPEGIAAQRAVIIPPFAKAEFQVRHGRAMHRQLRVMPRGPCSVNRGHRLMLPVTVMVGIVAPAVAEFDAADKSDVAFGSIGMTDDDELLVMRAAESHALVEQDLAPG